MKPWQIAIATVGVALTGLGIAMVVTNPSQAVYEQQALAYTVNLLTAQCIKAPKVFGNDFLQTQCTAGVNAGQPQIKQIIAANTQQQNLIFFSIYKTDLAVKSFLPLPEYHLEAVGAFNTFYIYQK